MQIAENLRKDWHVLLAGCGSIGRRHAGVLLELGITNLHACDASKEALDHLVAEHPAVQPCLSYEHGLEQKPDAVFILTPTALHIPMAIQAMEHGAHVFIEKPLSTSTAGVEQLRALSERSGRKAMIGFCFRYHAGLRKAKALLDAGRIGRLVSVRALMGEHFPDVRPDYRNTYYAQYSGAFELVHDLDLALWFANQPVTQAHAVYGPFSDIGIQAPDTVEILLAFADRCSATVHLDFFQTPRRRQIELIGTLGTIIVEFASWEAYTVSLFVRGGSGWDVMPDTTTRNDMFREEDSEFFRVIAENGTMPCGIDEAVKSLGVIEELMRANSCQQ